MVAKDITDAHLWLQLYAGYRDEDLSIFAEFLNPAAKPEAGFVVDFIGTRIRTSSIWKEARALDGQLTGVPVPADFHAEAIEWIGLLKAVRSAVGQYVALELGAGFGTWTMAGAVAARFRGINDIRLCAVEADPERFRLVRQHFLDNGFYPERHRLFQACVGATAGTARWPVSTVSSASEDWGTRPLSADTDYRGIECQNTEQIEIIAMLKLLKLEPLWDLVHIDVQGDEVNICRSCIDELNDRVRWIVAATHSRKLDGDLLELMCNAGWQLEHEKPAKFDFVRDPATLEAMTTMDGTQVWSNPRLVAGGRLTSFAQEISSSVYEFRTRTNHTYALDIKTKNTGTYSWFGRAEASVNAGYRWIDTGGNVLPIEGNRAPLSVPVIRPGDSDSLRLQVVAPPRAGSYTLLVSMVQEGVMWFHLGGGKPLLLHVTVE